MDVIQWDDLTQHLLFHGYILDLLSCSQKIKAIILYDKRV